ncbi:unnamed protein product [Leptosia nina]|uniref:Uncharacterized protein n=1 Tax=Leptosia nina TaxID=320188 RepID=A0AAV1JQ63_9NEOP
MSTFAFLHDLESSPLADGTALHCTYVARVEDGHTVTRHWFADRQQATLECGVRGDRGGSDRPKATSQRLACPAPSVYF